MEREFEKYLKPSEQQTARKTVETLLAAGYSLSVFDGEEITVKRSLDAESILGAMGTTDEDWLKVYPLAEGNPKPAPIGWVRFVWGNEDWVAIADYTTNLETVLQLVFSWVEEQETAASK